MPHISSNVSCPISAQQETELKARLGKAISILSGKSERWLMLSFHDNCRIYFAGENSKPSAFVEVQVLGKINPNESSSLSAEICNIFEETLSISPDRIYIKYEEVEQWGFNGGNF